MKSLNKLHAITLAVILFIALHFSLTLATNYMVKHSDNFPDLLVWLNLLASLFYVISGFIASMLLKHQFIYIGLITGLISALLAVLIFGVGYDAIGIFITLVTGFILGGVGGGLSLFFNRGVANAL